MTNKQRYKVLWTDYHNRKTISDRVLVENQGMYEAQRICARLRRVSPPFGDDWYQIARQEASVKHGMVDFV